jgi:hypothetical protein
MIEMLIEMLPVSCDKFAVVSGTSLNRDSAIVRTWQSAPCSQPTSARDRLSPLGSARLPTAGSPQAFAAKMTSDSDPFSLTRYQPNPLNMKMSLWVSEGDPIRYRRRSKANLPMARLPR